MRWHWRSSFAGVLLVAVGLVAGCGEQDAASQGAGSAATAQAAAMSAPAPAADPAPAVIPPTGAPAGKGEAALSAAAAGGEYLCALFRGPEDEATAAMRQVCDDARPGLAGRARFCEIDVADPAEAPVVRKLGATGAPLPLLLVVAPNGAITAGFPQNVSAADLPKALVGPGTAACIKALQDRKIVLACFQNDHTARNAEALRGAEEFKCDPRYAALSEIVTIDPRDSREAGLVDGLQVDREAAEAMTVVLVPPGTALGRIGGATAKADIERVLRSRPTSCGPGGTCAPGACAPGTAGCPR